MQSPRRRTESTGAAATGVGTSSTPPSTDRRLFVEFLAMISAKNRSVRGLVSKFITTPTRWRETIIVTPTNAQPTLSSYEHVYGRSSPGCRHGQTCSFQANTRYNVHRVRSDVLCGHLKYEELLSVYLLCYLGRLLLLLQQPDPAITDEPCPLIRQPVTRRCDGNPELRRRGRSPTTT